MRSALVTGLVVLVGQVATLGGCALQECTHLTDCAGGQVCSVDGACVAAEPLPVRDEVAWRGGGGGAALTEEVPGRITGDIGPVHAFDDDAVVVGGNHEDFGADFVATTQSDAGFGLVILWSPAPLGAGETRISGDAYDLGNAYVQLCSDSLEGDVHFDGIADDTIIVVTPTDDGGADVTVDSTITDGFEGYDAPGDEPTTVSVTFHLDAL